MEMKISSDAVKALRNDKLWSQEELATACGVSLRTIQRLEGEGQASADTLKALASVFEVSYEKLKNYDVNPNTYVNIQLGFAMLLMFSAISAFLAILFSKGLLNVLVFIILMLIIIAIGTLFSSLTTRVDSAKLESHFGFGILRKSIPISDILSSKTVRNEPWWGLGIRLTPHGWLYCVSGLDAVALRLSDGRKVRIGTDEPAELNHAIDVARAKSTR